MRLLGVLLLLAIIGAAAFVYDVKYRTTRLAREATGLEQKILAEKNTIATLRAEWSALNQPARLQVLAARHLPGYQNLAVTQMAFAYELPDRPLDLGKFIDNLDAQPGLEAPIDKKNLPPPLVRKPPPQAIAKSKTSSPVVSRVAAQPLRLMPLFNP